MSDDGSDLSYLADAGDDAASGSSLYQKAKSSIASGVGTAGAISGATAATAVALGASLGSVVPVAGTIVGAVIGTIVALFEFFKKNPNPGIDDAYWDTLGNEGLKTHEPNGLDISTAQLALVNRFAQGVVSQPNWQTFWPMTWWNIAHSNNPHSSLLADAVARFVGAPQSTQLPNGTHLTASDGRVMVIPNGSRGAPPFSVGGPVSPFAPPTLKGFPTVPGFIPIPSRITAPPSSIIKAVRINPATGLPYPSTGGTATTTGTGTTGLDMSSVGVGFSTVGSTLGSSMGGAVFDVTKLTPAQLASLKASVQASAAAGAAAAAAGPQALASGTAIIPIPAHVIVAAAAAGNAGAQNTVLNAVSAGRAPGATPAQTQLAETLALAHMIQTHAKYVQKWLGPAAAQLVLAGHYLTTANLGG